LSNLRKVLRQVVSDLSEGGRLAVISFHSKEDGIVKTTFKQYYKEGVVDILTKKPIVPTEGEVVSNPRSRSAKMRVISRRGK
jgi:16S rRNA (cytosine1402-N4)-methyltransferase